jgi:hypothetical protein
VGGQHVQVGVGHAVGCLPAAADLVDSEGDVLEVGMTSVSAVERSSTLIERTGLELPQGIIYDMYTPIGIADFLLAMIAEQRRGKKDGERRGSSMS